MKIHSFYANVTQLDFQAELRLSVLWRERWSAAGFEPIVLNEWLAAKHPDFKEFSEAVKKLPTVNPGNYEYYCYLRWMALAQAGGGYMSDLDVVPYNGSSIKSYTLPRPQRIETKLQLFQSSCPSLVYASSVVAEGLCAIFATGKLGLREINGKPHMSDMYSIADMDEHLVQRHDIVKGYGDPGWETAPFVHYSTSSLMPTGKIPKWKWIPKLREAK